MKGTQPICTAIICQRRKDIGQMVEYLECLLLQFEFSLLGKNVAQHMDDGAGVCPGRFKMSAGHKRSFTASVFLVFLFCA